MYAKGRSGTTGPICPNEDMAQRLWAWLTGIVLLRHLPYFTSAFPGCQLRQARARASLLRGLSTLGPVVPRLLFTETKQSGISAFSGHWICGLGRLVMLCIAASNHLAYMEDRIRSTSLCWRCFSFPLFEDRDGRFLSVTQQGRL